MRSLSAALVGLALVSAAARAQIVPRLGPVEAPVAVTFAAAGGLSAPAPLLAPVAPAAPSLELELNRSGFSAEQIGAIRQYSKDARPLGMDEFLAATPLDGNGYLLGIAGDGVYRAAAQATGLTSFQEVYAERFGKVRDNVTAEFMRFVTGTGDPVVFLVPPDALTHPQARVTKEELEWLFAHPERMANVHFVFGAHSSAPEDFAARRGALARPSDETRVAQRRRHQDGRDVQELQGEERLPAIKEFFAEMDRAHFVRDRMSSGKMYFASSRGYYVLQRAERGLFLDLPAASDGGRERQLFISREREPELYAATLAEMDAAY